MRRLGLAAAWVYTWFWFAPLFAVLTVLMGTASWLLSFATRRGADACGVIWGRVALALAGVRVRVHGRERVERGRQYVVMSNHRSHFDALVLYGHLGLPFLWVMKLELRKVPFLGPACARLGHIFIDRRDREQAVAALRAGLLRSAGNSVLFFPEGTRSATGDLLPFKKGGFVVAADAALPILPLSVRGSERVLPSHGLVVRPFRVIDVTFHAPVPAPAEAGAREAWMATVRERIASGLAAEPRPAALPAPAAPVSAATPGG